MSSMQDRLNKLREERIAREKARIEKLRQLNLKKYCKNEPLTRKSVSNLNCTKKNDIENSSKSNHAKNNFRIERSASAPITKTSDFVKPKITQNLLNVNKNKINDKVSSKPNDTEMKRIGSKVQTKIESISKVTNFKEKSLKKVTSDQTSNKPKTAIATKNSNIKIQATVKNDNRSRKSLATFTKPKIVNDRKSLQPKTQQTNQVSNNESVFDRLYKPKVVVKHPVDNAQKLKTDPNYLKKLIHNSNVIMNKRHTVFETKKVEPVRRSISAVHFKRINKSELGNCIHKWASIGEKINKAHVQEVNEDDGLKEEKVHLTVKSERKKVKFQTPLSINTPRPEELQLRLQNWLQKRGKSMDSYHHLQCFGLHHTSNVIKPFNVETPKTNIYDDEDKENIELENDSDNDSFSEIMNEQKNTVSNGSKVDFEADKWRRASYALSDTDLNESFETTLTSAGTMHHEDDLLLGALNDLTELLKEGFDWEQSARWLRAIREQFPLAPNSAPYWECRAALEERRGDLPASVQCWEQAIAKGTETSVVEANLDQLLDKFMQLKISPGSNMKRQVDPKLLDVKNVFKSTIIRFAVQQAKLNQPNGTPKYIVTPVRRSSRLSVHVKRTPLHVCASLHQAALMGSTEFKPNKALTETP